MPTLETIRQAPKALLHDHLDGGLRPATIVDLAREYGYAGLPTTDADELEAWMRRGADRKSLELYLETFAHTIGVMQERDAIIRVAAECAEDLAADGIVYAEVRYAPELSVERGLTLDEVVEANLEGFRIGAERAAAAGRSDRHEGARDGDAPVRPLARGGRMCGPLAGRGRRRLRHRRPRGRLPPDPLSRGVRLRPPRELPHHDPRRRVVRAAIDLGSAPVLRCRAARARRADRRRHHDAARRLRGARAARRVRPRPARAARDVPDLERAYRGGAVGGRSPDRPAAPACVTG